jgi:SAM-dependent methyltransferase
MTPAFHCRACGSHAGRPVLDLGLQPLANNLPRPEDLGRTEPRFPLRLAVCESCWMLQITDIVPPVELFSEYLYFSSFSDAMLRHARLAAEQHIASEKLHAGSFVVEVASNDGYLLRNFVDAGIPCLGIEPATNIARVASEKGIPTLNRFFTLDLARQLATPPPAGRVPSPGAPSAGEPSPSASRADLILGNNVFAHVPDTNDFVAALAALVKPTGRIVLEFPYACDLVEHLEFDTIYHEHVFYFTLTSLIPLFARHGLDVVDVERIPIHGGSLRFSAAPAGSRPIADSVRQLLAEETEKGVASHAYYEAFAGKVHALRTQLLDLLRDLRAKGHRVAAYGASAKGSTLLNFYGIGRDGFDALEFVADRSTAKQGRLTPGSHLPIVPPSELLARRPDFALLLTWNFADEILAQQQEYRTAGGRFILPVPTVRIV